MPVDRKSDGAQPAHRKEARGRGSDALDVVDAVLKADNQRVASDMAGKLSCRLFGVVALHTEEHQLRIRGCRNVG